MARPEVAAAAVQGVAPVPMAASAATMVMAQPMVSAEVATRAALEPMLKEAVEAVAQMVQVTPGLTRGEGEVRLRLRPTVLDGSEVRLLFREGQMTVQVEPASEPVRQLLVQQQAMLAQALSERLPTFRVAVTLAGRDPEARKTKREND